MDHNADNFAANSCRNFPYKMKKFVCASTSSQAEQNVPRSQKPSLNKYENGDHVSNFYLNVCKSRENNCRRYSSSSDDEVIFCEVRSKKKKFKSTKNKVADLRSDNQRSINRAMKFAQLDEVENLKYLIDEGLSVNTTDNFGWSLLMVASYAGSKNVVKFLISKGARRGKRDGKGNTALYLASKNNHLHIVNLLIKKTETSEGKERPLDQEIIEIDETDAFFCELCNMTPSCSQREHETSIVHLFHLGSGNTRTMYGIPRSNVGFQMLLQQGWNDSKGLGPEGVGRKYPIKAMEKQDRLGLGHSSTDVDSESVCKRTIVESNTSRYNKYSEKQKEKYLRRMLNEPDF